MFELLFPRKRMAEVVEGLMRQFAEEQGLSDLGRSELFETFAAYCLVKREQLEFDPDELRVGGPRDLGIDAYVVKINNELHTDAAAVREVVAREPQLDVHFIVIQAKRSPHFEGKVFNELAT